ncbi:MAG: LamG domain-containing protein [Gammaproteobacteria bacterium]|nr:LamG domain-containing protein [Gammaproteobacteria bacterium]
MKSNARDNRSNGGCNAGNSENWITGNIILDRAIWSHDRHGDYGLSMFSNGSNRATLAFGTFQSNASGGGVYGTGLCGTRNVADGNWHHVAVTRQASTGALRLYVDGQLDAQGTGPRGNISYRDGQPSSVPNYISLNVDHYLGIGAEKYDADPVRYPSFNGFIDELRLSTASAGPRRSRHRARLRRSMRKPRRSITSMKRPVMRWLMQ